MDPYLHTVPHLQTVLFNFHKTKCHSKEEKIEPEYFDIESGYLMMYVH